MLGKLFCGIDPGTTGGIAFFCPDSGDMESHTYPGTPANLLLLMRKYSDPVLTSLEKVNASKQQGVTSIFTFGRSYGQWEQALVCRGWPYIDVPPQTWQAKIIGRSKKLKSGDKSREYMFVQKRFPKLRINKSDTGRIDAICLAYYTYLVFTGKQNEVELPPAPRVDPIIFNV